MLRDDIQKHSRFSNELKQIRNPNRFGKFVRKNSALGENEHIARILGDNSFIERRQITSLRSQAANKALLAGSAASGGSWALGALGSASLAAAAAAGSGPAFLAPVATALGQGGATLQAAGATVRNAGLTHILQGVGGAKFFGRAGKTVVRGES